MPFWNNRPVKWQSASFSTVWGVDWRVATDVNLLSLRIWVYFASNQQNAVCYWTPNCMLREHQRGVEKAISSSKKL